MQEFVLVKAITVNGNVVGLAVREINGLTRLETINEIIRMLEECREYEGGNDDVQAYTSK